MNSSGWTRRTLLRNAAGAGLAVGGAAMLPGRIAAAATASTAATPQKIALTNVRVFDGHALTAPRTVVIDNGVIGVSTLGATTIDGGGATLLPGLIDAHVHLEDVATLQQLIGYGVTTALDMACWPPSLVNSLRHRSGLTDIRSAGTPAVAPGSLESELPGFPAAGVVSGASQALPFVIGRTAEGSDYIKIIAELPGFDRTTITALVRAAHLFGKLANAHAVTNAVVEEVLVAGVDMVHHVPLDTALTAAQVTQYAAHNVVSIPTLTMMEGFGELGIPGVSYASAKASVTALHAAGVQILAGTDSNHKTGIPVQPAFGTSLHHELELLVGAGLSTVDALRSATILPAQSYRLSDRGAIQPGLRADLVLIDGDPTVDITKTRHITRIWVGGVEATPAPWSTGTREGTA